jgi:triphosphoribosyl-dephospho-CoA synthetase
MTTLIFKNETLQGIMKLTEVATQFTATFEEAVSEYERLLEKNTIFSKAWKSIQLTRTPHFG